jgi:ATP diphosphatase
MTDTHGNGPDALRASWAIQEAASALGFDWPDISGVFEKVHEEIGEIRHAWELGHRDHARRELGDLLFATVNVARFLGTDPNGELDRANARFTRRFAMLRKIVKDEGRVLEQCTLAELDAVWERVKRMGVDPPEKEA